MIVPFEPERKRGVLTEEEFASMEASVRGVAAIDQPRGPW